MSALSEQCEALRLWAKHLREGEPVLASDLREAADTILNLRDMAQQAQSEKAALEWRIDELCAEVERMHADQAHWELGNCPSCPNVVSLQEALEQNSKLCAEVEALKRDEWSAGFSAGCEAVEAAYEDGKAHYEVENAKLRELVSDYSDCLDTALLLAADAGYPVMPARDKFLSLERRKREMEIEVD